MAAGAADEAGVWFKLPGAANTVAGVAGKTTAVISVGMKTAEFINDPSEATGAQLANEGAKTLTGFACPPVGLIWAGLDLTGYGPSQILDSMDKSTKALRAAAKYSRQAAPRIAAQQRHVGERLKVLNQKTAKLNETTRKVLKGDTRSLEELNVAIQQQERINRRTASELRRVQAEVRRLEAK